MRRAWGAFIVGCVISLAYWVSVGYLIVLSLGYSPMATFVAIVLASVGIALVVATIKSYPRKEPKP